MLYGFDIYMQYAFALQIVIPNQIYSTKFFIDTANLNQILAAHELGVLDGLPQIQV